MTNGSTLCNVCLSTNVCQTFCHLPLETGKRLPFNLRVLFSSNNNQLFELLISTWPDTQLRLCQTRTATFVVEGDDNVAGFVD